MTATKDKFSHPTNYKRVVLQPGERTSLAKGQNRGVKASLVWRRREQARFRAQDRAYAINQIANLVAQGKLKIKDVKKWCKTFSTKQLQDVVAHS